MAKRREDLTGRHFGRLKVIKFDHTDKYGTSHWLCECECGNEKVISSNSLKYQRTKSCGCIRKETSRNAYKAKKASKTKKNKGIYYFEPDEEPLKGNYEKSKVKEYKLSPTELEQYLKELPNKEVQYVGARG